MPDLEFFEIRKVDGNPRLFFCADEPHTNEDAHDISIEKWRTVLSHLREGILLRVDDGDEQGCGYCHMYLTREDYCEQCPIYQETGYSLCYETPYRDFVECRYDLNFPGMIDAAEREIDFLDQIRKTFQGE